MADEDFFVLIQIIGNAPSYLSGTVNSRLRICYDFLCSPMEKNIRLLPRHIIGKTADSPKEL